MIQMTCLAGLLGWFTLLLHLLSICSVERLMYAKFASLCEFLDLSLWWRGSYFDVDIVHLPADFLWRFHSIFGYIGGKCYAFYYLNFWRGYNSIFFMFLVKPLEDPKKTTDIILEALKNTGQRGIIDRGWGNLGTRECLPVLFIYDKFPIPFYWLSKKMTMPLNHMIKCKWVHHHASLSSWVCVFGKRSITSCCGFIAFK